MDGIDDQSGPKRKMVARFWEKGIFGLFVSFMEGSVKGWALSL